jgi:hypothetical protein
VAQNIVEQPPTLLQEFDTGGPQVIAENALALKQLKPKSKVTDVCVDVSVGPRPDVAVHALVIPDVPPAGSHPWS